MSLLSHQMPHIDTVRVWNIRCPSSLLCLRANCNAYSLTRYCPHLLCTITLLHRPPCLNRDKDMSYSLNFYLLQKCHLNNYLYIYRYHLTHLYLKPIYLYNHNCKLSFRLLSICQTHHRNSSYFPSLPQHYMYHIYIYNYQFHHKHNTHLLQDICNYEPSDLNYYNNIRSHRIHCHSHISYNLYNYRRCHTNTLFALYHLSYYRE